MKSDIYSLGVLILEIVTGLEKDLNAEDISSRLFIDNVSNRISILVPINNFMLRFSS